MKWIVTHQTVKSEDYAWIPQATLWNHLRGHWHQGGTQQTTENNSSILENCTIKTLKAATKTGGCILGVWLSRSKPITVHLSWKETLYQGTWRWSSWISDLGGWGLEKFSRAWIGVKIENSRDKFLRMSFSEHYIDIYTYQICTYMYVYISCIRCMFWVGRSYHHPLQDPHRAIFPEVPVASSGGAMVGGPGPSAPWCFLHPRNPQKVCFGINGWQLNWNQPAPYGFVCMADWWRSGCWFFVRSFCGAVFQISRPRQILMHKIEILNVFSNSAFIDPVFFWIYPGPQDSTGKL